MSGSPSFSIDNHQLTLRGCGLRATAVGNSAGCCAFLGDPGVGKSTLAAAFVRRGWTLVCDDYLEFDPQQEGITIIPGSRDLWLWPDSIAAAFNDGVRLQSVQDGRKKRVQLAGMEPVHPIRLGCVYLLTPPEHTSDARIRIDAAPASEAFYEVVRQAFRLDEADRKLLAHQFGYVKWLVESLPIWRLSYPRDFTLVQAVAGAVNDHLQSSALVSFPSHVSPGPQHPPRVMY